MRQCVCVCRECENYIVHLSLSQLLKLVTTIVLQAACHVCRNVGMSLFTTLACKVGERSSAALIKQVFLLNI